MANNHKDKRIYILILCLVVVIIMVIAVCIRFITDKVSSHFIIVTDNSEMVINSLNDFKSVKDIIEYSNSKYIKELNCNEDGFSLKYQVVFGKNLYINGENQKSYFDTIIFRIARFYNYSRSFILIDEVNNIEIKVKCSNSKVKDIIINGERNYFTVHDNLNSFSETEEQVFTELNISSQELKKTISNNWNYNSKIYGELDSNFEKYDIFGDEGIEVKTIQNKVFNLAFNSNYSEDIFENIDINYSIDDIIKKLGEPTFQDNQEFAIGYECKDFYVFFANNNNFDNRISIYAKESVDYSEFEELLGKYVDSKMELKDFMNQLTYLWPNYEEYSYNENYVKIVYPIQGVSIEYGKGLNNGINIYKNYNISEFIEDLAKKGVVVLKNDELLIYNTEIDKIASYSELRYFSSVYNEQDYNISEIVSSKYNVVYKKNNNNEIIKALFVSLDKNYFDTELRENIYYGFFISDFEYVYSIKNRGIYLYNIETKEKEVITEGTDEYKIEKFEERKIYYDNSIISLE